MNNMNMQEASRVILGLRAAGWDEKEINDFILYIETGEEKYKPMQKNKPTEQAGNRQGRAGLPPLPHQKNYSKNKDGLQYAIPIQEKSFCAFFVCNFIHVINYLCIFLRDNIHGNLFSQNLGSCRFGTTSDGRPGYKKAGADTVYPFMADPVALGMPTFTGPSTGNYCHSITLSAAQAKYDILIITARFSTDITSISASGSNGTEIISSDCGKGWMATCVLKPTAGDKVQFFHGGTGDAYAYVYGL